MNLKDLTIEEQSKYTSHYPLLITGSNNAGKSYALEQMNDEDKKRTLVLNFDTKSLGTGSSSEFYAVYAVSSTNTQLKTHLAKLVERGKELATKVDKKDPALVNLRAQVAHIKSVLNSSYFIDDIEAIDKVVNHILDATFNPDIDRIVVDTFSALVDFCDAWAAKNFAGREIWAEYGKALQRVQQAMREATLFGYKYTYTYAHHEFIPALQYDVTPKKVVAVKGGIMKGNVETSYNTIVYAHVTEDGKRMFSCDVDNSLDTSRTKLLAGKFHFERKSLDDLEQIFAGKKEVTDDGELVDVTKAD